MIRLLVRKIMKYRNLYAYIVFVCPNVYINLVFDREQREWKSDAEIKADAYHQKQERREAKVEQERRAKQQDQTRQKWNAVQTNYQKMAQADWKKLQDTPMPVTQLVPVSVGQPSPPAASSCKISLVASSMSAAIQQQKGASHVLVLVSAHPRRPHKAYIKGSLSPEGALSRQYPNLIRSLHRAAVSSPSLYPLTNQVLYTPNVRQFRNTANKKVAPDKAGVASFLVAAPPDSRKLEDVKDDVLSAHKTVVGVLDRALNAPQTVPLVGERPTIIIGAWGCGLFAPNNSDARRKYQSIMIQLLVDRIQVHCRQYAHIVIACKHPALSDCFGRCLTASSHLQLSSPSTWIYTQKPHERT
jgi:uncharacterized protein (TIGR02452 family)